MVMSHCDLKDALEDGSESSLGFMPERLKGIVTFVPLAAIECSQPRVKA